MASAVLDKVRGHLQCPTCLGIFDNPVTLECGHSFCLNCLNGYVQAHPTAVTRQILPCSVCRHETKVPHPRQPVKDWGKQLKPSFTIRQLTEDIKTSLLTSNGEDNCFLCLGHGETTLAVCWCLECEISLCQRCSRTHQLTPGTKDHDIIEVQEKSRKRKPFKVLCPEHKELIKFQCKDCKKSACNSCCTIQHRKCDNIVSIQSVLRQMESSIAENHKTVLDRLQDKEIDLTVLKSQLKFVQSKQDATLSKIKDVEKRMMTLLQEKYQNDKDEVQKAAEEEKSALQAAIKTAQLDIEMYRQHAAVLSQLLESREETDISNTHEFCQSGSLLTEDARDHPKRDHVIDIDFCLCEDKIQLLLSDIGQVKVTKKKGTWCIPKLVKTVNTQTEEDKECPELVGIIAMRVRNKDVFISSDINNECVKCFFIRDKASGNTPPSNSCSVCQLEGGPSGITKLRDNRVMVSVPTMCQLVTLHVTPNLVKDMVNKTQSGYDSLCMLNSGLLAAGRHGSVDLLRVSSDSVTIVRSLTDHSVFKWPRNLTVSIHDSNNIIVSDCVNHIVTCLTSEGDIKWTYTSPPGTSFKPRGVTTTRRGDVVVADHDSHNIVLLTMSGVHKADILTGANSGVFYPQSVHCDDRGYLFVTNYIDTVLIYKLTEI